MSTPQKKCLVCDRPAQNVGLCPACYQAARQAIWRRETTQEELISKGLMLRPYANAKRSDFAKALERLKAKKSRNVAAETPPLAADKKPSTDPWTLALWDMT